jgi:hypothetical protein
MSCSSHCRDTSTTHSFNKANSPSPRELLFCGEKVDFKITIKVKKTEPSSCLQVSSQCSHQCLKFMARSSMTPPKRASINSIPPAIDQTLSFLLSSFPSPDQMESLHPTTTPPRIRSDQCFDTRSRHSNWKCNKGWRKGEWARGPYLESEWDCYVFDLDHLVE